MSNTERPNQKPDIKLQAMSSRSLTLFHADGTTSSVWRQMDGRVGGTIEKPGKVRWDPTDSRPRRGARLYPAGTHFELIYGGSPEECAVWGAWLPQPEARA